MHDRRLLSLTPWLSNIDGLARRQYLTTRETQLCFWKAQHLTHCTLVNHLSSALFSGVNLLHVHAVHTVFQQLLTAEQLGALLQLQGTSAVVTKEKKKSAIQLL